MLSSCTHSFCTSFSKSQGAVMCPMFYFGEIRGWTDSFLWLISTKVLPQYRLFFLYLVCFRCFRISAPWNQFQTKKIVNRLYCFIICFKHTYHQARTGMPWHRLYYALFYYNYEISSFFQKEKLKLLVLPTWPRVLTFFQYLIASYCGHVGFVCLVPNSKYHCTKCPDRSNTETSNTSTVF